MTRPSVDLTAHPNVRLGAPADIEELLPIINHAYRNPAGWTNESHLVEGARALKDDLLPLMDESATPSTAVLVYTSPSETGGECLLGCINISMTSPQVGYFGLLAVSQAHQSQGIGRRLLTAAFDVLKQWGADKCEITVLIDRDQIMQWYERHGFVKTGKCIDFPKDAGESKLKPGVRPYLVVMERQL
ncbi:acyl-CoA N-acyltransferase [Gaertneriomyces semiglobifer]|nr:acyl-CoA N-acyltransferase [Gaertneriomyces semiglobifer]